MNIIMKYRYELNLTENQSWKNIEKKLTAPLQYNLIFPSGVRTITDILLRVLKMK